MIKQNTKEMWVKRYGIRAAVLCFWLLVWELSGRWVGNEIFLPSPLAVTEALVQLCKDLNFWQTILFSSFRIILGFLLALTIGILLAVTSYRNRIINELISPLMKIIKAMPVASFIILALVWIKAKNLSVLISFLMVVPVIYTNVFQGLRVADEKLLQMAKVFHIGSWKTIKAIYIPSVIPYFISAVSVGLGFCWKSGIAAEVIGIPAGSIGERLYEAKLYLMTKELFAWTIVIILISVLFEKAVMLLLRTAQNDK